MNDIFYLIDAFVLLKIGITIVIILYFVIILYKVCKISKNTNKCVKELKLINENITKNNESNSAYLRQFTKQLERIAKALEQEPEPYIIESNNENEFSNNRSSTGNP